MTSPSEASDSAGSLTLGQYRIAARLYAGSSVKQVARELGISTKGVYRQMARARDRLVGRGRGDPKMVLVRWVAQRVPRPSETSD